MASAQLVFKPSKDLKLLMQGLQARELVRPLNEFLIEAALRVQRNATQKQIIRGGSFRKAKTKTVLVAKAPHPTKVTSRTGELRRSIGSSRGIDRSKFPREVSIGSEIVYAGTHEYGLRVRSKKFPKRAFLQPAMDAESPKFERLLLAKVKAHLPGGR